MACETDAMMMPDNYVEMRSDEIQMQCGKGSDEDKTERIGTGVSCIVKGAIVAGSGVVGLLWDEASTRLVGGLGLVGGLAIAAYGVGYEETLVSSM